jgi:hypothetical protein
VGCVDGRCTVSDAATTCDEGLLCSTVLSTDGLEGFVIREEGTTDDYTVESVVLGQVFARDSSNNPVVLDDVPGNYAFCSPPPKGSSSPRS